MSVEVLRVIVEQREAVLEWVSGGDDVDRLHWFGDRVCVHRPGELARWLVLDEEGNYDLQPMGWM